jgi:hypothetical protein
MKSVESCQEVIEISENDHSKLFATVAISIIQNGHCNSLSCLCCPAGSGAFCRALRMDGLTPLAGHGGVDRNSKHWFQRFLENYYRVNC